MTTFLLTTLAIAVSTLGVAHLTATDPKRQRVFGLHAPNRNRRQLAWAGVYLPGLLLLIFDAWSAALMWFGGLPLVGWAIAATAPQTFDRLALGLRQAQERLGNLGGATREHLRDLATRKQREREHSASARIRIQALESRVTELEATIERMQRATTEA